jgi:hypothetical protein
LTRLYTRAQGKHSHSVCASGHTTPPTHAGKWTHLDLLAAGDGAEGDLSEALWQEGPVADAAHHTLVLEGEQAAMAAIEHLRRVSAAGRVKGGQGKQNEASSA